MNRTFKRLLSLLVAVLLLTAAACPAALAAKTSGKVSKGVKWSYNKKNRTLTLSGKGSVPGSWYEDWAETYQHSADKLVLKEGITAVGAQSFMGMTLKKLSLPNSLTKIGEDAFAETKLPATVTLPKNVKKIGNSAFARSKGLKKFKVAKDSKSFSVSGGVLYNKSQSLLVACPPEKTGEYVISSKTKKILGGAFCQSRLKKLTVPASVTSIGEDAFLWAKCQSIWFNGNVPSDLEYFDETSKVKRIYFPQAYYTAWDKFQAKSDGLGFPGDWYYFRS